MIINSVASRGAEHKVSTRGNEIFIYLNLHFHIFVLVALLKKSAALNAATQHAMPPEFDGKWGTKCLNIRLRHFVPHLPLCLTCCVRDTACS